MLKKIVFLLLLVSISSYSEKNAGLDKIKLFLKNRIVYCLLNDSSYNVNSIDSSMQISVKDSVLTKSEKLSHLFNFLTNVDDFKKIENYSLLKSTLDVDATFNSENVFVLCKSYLNKIESEGNINDSSKESDYMEPKLIVDFILAHIFEIVLSFFLLFILLVVYKKYNELLKTIGNVKDALDSDINNVKNATLTRPIENKSIKELKDKINELESSLESLMKKKEEPFYSDNSLNNSMVSKHHIEKGIEFLTFPDENGLFREGCWKYSADDGNTFYSVEKKESNTARIRFCDNLTESVKIAITQESKFIKPVCTIANRVINPKQITTKEHGIIKKIDEQNWKIDKKIVINLNS